MVKRFIIVRGLPGGGKSFLAEKLKKNFEANNLSCSVLTTDDFFVHNNQYNFDGSLLSVAHPWNLGRVIRSMMIETDVIIVPNTSTQAWEIKEYYKNAMKFGYSFDIKEPETSWKFDIEECAAKNSHGIGVDIIEKMLDRWESTEDVLKTLTGNV